MKTDRATTAVPKGSLEHRVLALFARMSRQVRHVAKEPTLENVHHFRTNSRRIEAVLQQLTPEGASESKLLKQLSKLRKKVGKVRDLDVQITFLKELRVPDRHSHRAQLLASLEEEKSRRFKKLAARFDGNTVRKLCTRLRKASAGIDLAGIDPLKLAFTELPRPGTTPLNERELHACRIAAKRARYLAELSDAPAAGKFIEELKRAQDAVGEWHDVLKLTERAEKLFGGVRESSLVAVLQNISRARFRRATSSLLNALRAVSELRQQQSPPSRGVSSAVLSAGRVAAA